MENRDPREACEVGAVEGEEAADAVQVHGCHEPGIVGNLAVPGACDDQLLPFVEK